MTDGYDGKPAGAFVYRGHWWQIGIQTYHFMISVGRSLLHNRIGVEVCLGKVKSPPFGCSRYRYNRFLRFLPL
jgi:hypothetical protein